MILQRSFLRELANVASAVFITLLTIVLTVALVRHLGRAANGIVSNESVVALITFSALNSMPLVLQLTVFIAVLLVLTRQWRDGEMVVWQASGVGLARWLLPVLAFALPLAIVVGMLSFFVSPWANRQADEFSARFQQRADVARVSPGQFRESADGSRVFFVEGIADDFSQVRNVFIRTWHNGELGLVVSESGRVERQANGEQFLILEKGRRYEGEPGTPAYGMIEFERYGLRVEAQLPNFDSQLSTRARSTGDLLADGSNASLGELVWRLGVPLSMFALAALALPLSFVNPRAGRSANLMIALLVYVTYSNGLSVLQDWTSRGRVSFALSWWILHVLVLAIAFGLLWWHTRIHRPIRWRFWTARAGHSAGNR